MGGWDMHITENGLQCSISFHIFGIINGITTSELINNQGKNMNSFTNSFSYKYIQLSKFLNHIHFFNEFGD